MKRLIPVGLIIFLTFILTSCGNKAGPSTVKEPSTPGPKQKAQESRAVSTNSPEQEIPFVTYDQKTLENGLFNGSYLYNLEKARWVGGARRGYLASPGRAFRQVVG